jgi:hypothetical protein
MRQLKRTRRHATVAGAARDRELVVREFGSGAEDSDRKRRSEKLVAAILQDGIMTKGKNVRFTKTWAWVAFWEVRGAKWPLEFRDII